MLDKRTCPPLFCPLNTPGHHIMPLDPDQELSRQHAVTAAAYFVQVAGVATVLYNNPGYHPQPYHPSALSGIAWINELIHGHPNRILCELGMRLHVYQAFCAS